MSTQVIGHRGAAGLAPENTLASFQKALDLGVDALELDVHLTKDSQVVVHHDARLNPALTRDKKGNWLSGKTPAIKDLTYEELSQFNVGALDPRALYAQNYPRQVSIDGQRIPLLSEVLDLTKPSGTPLYIELKTDPSEFSDASDPYHLSKAVLKVIQEHKAQDRVHLMSFDWRGPLSAAQTDPNVKPCFITEESGGCHDNVMRYSRNGSPWLSGYNINDFSGSIPAMIKAAGGHGWNVHYHNLTEKDLVVAKALGLKVVVWTPNTKHALKKMIDMGVDGITTNHPDILLKLLNRL